MKVEKAIVFLYTHHVFLRCKEIQKCQVKKRWYARTQTSFIPQNMTDLFFFQGQKRLGTCCFCTIQVAFQQSLQVEGAQQQIPHHGSSRGGKAGCSPRFCLAKHPRALYNFNLKNNFTSQY